jgi:peptidoglycan/LPS O-acetylase OafA/YrhL
MNASVENRSDSNRILELDGLRAFAILSVFLYHVWSLPLSWMGVDVFFVLSGFLITGILLGRRSKPGYLKDFYGRRARRILAPYYLLLVLSSVLFGTAWIKQWYWYVFFASNVPNALHSVPHPSLDVLWSLAVEEHFYLLWPVAILFLSETALLWAATMLIVIAPVLRGIATYFVTTSAPIYHLMPFRMDLLAAGALIALLWRKSPVTVREVPSLGPIMVACGGGALFTLSFFASFRTGTIVGFNHVVLYSLTLLVAVGFLLWSLQERGWFPTILRWSVLRFIGRISYSMYLVHVCFIILVAQRFSNRWVIFSVAFAATVAYSTISWFVLEKRLLSRTAPHSKAETVKTRSLPDLPACATDVRMDPSPESNYPCPAGRHDSVPVLSRRK